MDAALPAPPPATDASYPTTSARSSLGEESVTPRSYVKSKNRSSSSSQPEPLLQVTAGVNGRLGLATSTTITITETTISYGRYEIPLEEIEQAVRA